MTRHRASPILFAFLGVAGGLAGSLPAAHAAVTLGGRIGFAAPIQGSVADDLNLDVGIGAGASLGTDVTDYLSVDVRYDAIYLLGSLFDNADSSSITHAVSVGPQLELHEPAFDVYLGVHPGAYFTQLSVSGTAQRNGREINVDSDYSVDFGFNTELGVRYFVSNEIFFGGELTYHLILLDDGHLGFDVEGTPFEGGKIDDSMGTFGFALAFGYRF